MTDYISREAILTRLKRIIEVNRLRTDRMWFTPDGVEYLINEIPAADVRPVVACCDCKHFQVNVSPSGYLPQGVSEWECRYWCRPTDPTDFCSYGEKREES